MSEKKYLELHDMDETPERWPVSIVCGKLDGTLCVSADALADVRAYAHRCYWRYYDAQPITDLVPRAELELTGTQRWGMQLLEKLGQFIEQTATASTPMTTQIVGKLPSGDQPLIHIWATTSDTEPAARCRELAAELAATQQQLAQAQATAAAYRHDLEHYGIKDRDGENYRCAMCGAQGDGVAAPTHRTRCILSQPNPGQSLLDRMNDLVSQVSSMDVEHTIASNKLRRLTETGAQWDYDLKCWLMPYYAADGTHEMLPMGEWIARRKEAARDNAKLLKLIEDACFDHNEAGDGCLRYGTYSEQDGATLIPPESLPNIPAIEDENAKLRAEVATLPRDKNGRTITLKASVRDMWGVWWVGSIRAFRDGQHTLVLRNDDPSNFHACHPNEVEVIDAAASPACDEAKDGGK